ncbi:Lar family restriction alleviation protein [Cupriavidus basilensis]|uniref:Lar family restriction alleviation protein n=1 Tax=Cupriavidus basilensis TaxID=68895 RepID=UPI0009E573E8|nr:Lar family restriction alleviation protein [Cupriavidus basilensis]
MTESAELKPCPFCGARPTLKRLDEIVGISCGEESGCDNTGLFIAFAASKETEAIAAWNRRPLADATDGWRTLVEDLVEELEEQVCYRYQGYPQDDRRFVRDMLTVKEAREFLEAHKDKP